MNVQFYPLGLRKRPVSSWASFTLVEMVIAIGVTAFVLISLLGLMSYASQVVQQSDKYVRLSAVTRQVLTTLGSEPFSEGPYGVGASQGTAPVSTNFYFTDQGLPTNSAGAYYQCTVSDAAPSGQPFTNAAGKALMEPIRIIIQWPKPASGSAPFANTNVVVTSILQYD